MVHFLYPYTTDRRKASAEVWGYGGEASDQGLSGEGAKARHLQGQIFGGSWNGTLAGTKIAKENVRIARTVLASQHIALLSRTRGLSGTEDGLQHGHQRNPGLPGQCAAPGGLVPL
jgi:chemotaxis receptor (MCP) glutamine deamidase CheD